MRKLLRILREDRATTIGCDRSLWKHTTVFQNLERDTQASLDALSLPATSYDRFGDLPVVIHAQVV